MDSNKALPVLHFYNWFSYFIETETVRGLKQQDYNHQYNTSFVTEFVETGRFTA